MKRLFFVMLLGVTLLVLAGCAQQATPEQTEFAAEDLDAICGAYAATSETEAGAALAPALSGSTGTSKSTRAAVICDSPCVLQCQSKVTSVTCFCQCPS